MQLILPARICLVSFLASVAAFPTIRPASSTEEPLSHLEPRGFSLSSVGYDGLMAVRNINHHVPRAYSRLTKSKEEYRKGELQFHTDRRKVYLAGATKNENLGRATYGPWQSPMTREELHKNTGIYGERAEADRFAANWHHQKMLKYGHKELQFVPKKTSDP